MRSVIWILLIAFTLPVANAQNSGKYFTREGNISFFSDARTEKIAGQNSKVNSAIDIATGKIEFAVLIKSFMFEKALMQEHFNENYMESDQFPKATFKGSISPLSAVNFVKDGTYPVIVTGVLTIHGVSKNVTLKGPIVIKGNMASIKTSFNVLLSDYNINIPSIVKDKLNNTVKITVDCSYNKV